MTIEVEIQGTGQIIEFPDGTTPEVIQNALASFRTQQAQQPVEQAPTEQQAQTDTTLVQDVDNALANIPGAMPLAEFAAGVNRSVLGALDFIGPDNINAILELGGSETRVPTFTESFGAQPESFVEGLPGRALGTAGELAAVGAGAGQLLRGTAQTLSPLAAASEGAGAGVLRQLGVSAPKVDVLAGAASGAGEEVGREVGGETGALVGGVVAPVAAIGAQALSKPVINSIRNKFGRNAGLISKDTGLPTPAFEKALEKKGLDFGSIIDDVDNLPVLSGRKNADQVVDSIIKRKLINRSSDNALAGLKLVGNKVVKDPIGDEAVRQGFRAGDVSAAKSASPESKRQMKKMLNMTRQIEADSSKAQEFRPTDVVGENVLDRFKFIRGKADGLRKDLDSLSSTELKGKTIDSRAIERNVFDQLERLGIQTSDEGVPTLNFAGSDIAKDRTSQRVIRDVIDLLAEGGDDAFRAHKLKRQLDSLIDFNKKSAQGLTETGRNFAKSVRSSLNEEVRKVNPRYAQINDDLSKSIESMNEFQRVLGGQIDVFKPGAEKAIGQDLRGLLSNRKSRVKLENSINDLNNTASQLGGEFDVNVKDLVQFANTLDDRFGAVARTSLKGEVESGVKQVARGRSGAADLAVEVASKKAEQLRGINDKNAFNAMSKILGK